MKTHFFPHHVLTLGVIVVLAVLPKLARGQGDEAPAAVSLIPEVGPDTSVPVPALPDDGATIVDCYDAAVANLEKVCEDYRRIKALELSKIRDIAFLDAYENVQSVMPILQPINRDLLRKKITDPDEIPAHKTEVEHVESKVETMIELVTRLLLEIEIVQQQLAESSSTEERDAMTLAEIVNSPEYDPDKTEENENEQRSTEASDTVTKQLIEKAKQNDEKPAIDVSQEMKELTKNTAPPPPPPPPKTGAQEEEKGKSSPSGPPGKVPDTQFVLKDLNYDVGRQVVDSGGSPVEFMFVDTWYIIGPFPNPKRVNLNTKFPPETVVNLNATYLGKDNRVVGWEFLQTNTVKCIPLHDEEYAIYYAYSELYFDRPMDLWIAIGSDDKANVWVNGLPVWISGDQLKGWNPREGLRLVHFQAGVNKVLYRVENGWKGTVFSLGIQVK